MSKEEKSISTFQKDILLNAAKDAFRKLDPRTLLKNPVIFVTFVGAALSTVILAKDGLQDQADGFGVQIVIWLWFTVLFANFAEALAEGRGKAQAESLKKTRTDTMAKRMNGSNVEMVKATLLQKGDLVVCEAGDVIPCDGEIVEGVASVDESAITGESAPVLRESGGDRSAVTGGTKVLSDRILIRVTASAGDSFLDRMIAMVEGASRQKTPNEIALTMLLSGMTLIFLMAVGSLWFFAQYTAVEAKMPLEKLVTIPVLVALLVCLIPTTIGGLLSAIGISGMDRMIRKNVIATSGKAVEVAGDIDVLLLDKTGTITLGNRMATAFHPAQGVSEEELANAAQLSSLPDETPEGRSIVVLAKERFNLRGRDLTDMGAVFVPFTAESRMSGVDLDGRQIRKGAGDSVRAFIESRGGNAPQQLLDTLHEVSSRGGTPLMVAENNRALGVVELKDVVKGGIKERFAQLRAMGIRTVMITGDNPITAAAIAAEAGVDDFIAQAKPETKLARIRDEQTQGRLVAMIGDGTNDAPALAQADVGVAMNTGTQAAREASNMVDLDSNPTKLIDIVETGKQMLMTRGSLTTFSIANDVAKYFAILPALFGVAYAAGHSAGPLSMLNVMALGSPRSAILSAVIFNALIIIALVPLALRGVPYRPLGAVAVLRRNLLVYGLGGLVLPFFGIKVLDVVINLLGLA